MYARTYSMAINGLDAYTVTVEVNITKGLPAFEIVGLPTAAVREAKERVRAAITNAGFTFPMQRIVVNLAPADIRKDGAGLDVAIAVGIIFASAQGGRKLNKNKRQYISDHTVFIGEMALDGTIKSVRGMLAIAIAADDEQWELMVTGVDNGKEAKAAFANRVMISSSLSELMNMLCNDSERTYATADDRSDTKESYTADFSDVKGQQAAKQALEIAAAGGHHVLLCGVPGAGKTMLARCMPSILPPLTETEQLTISRIYSIAGLLPSQQLMKERPFRSPHHTITMAGMVGGGAIPKPGELTLSHGGVLFLDEAPEFKRPVLDVLRQPLEDGVVTISRASGSYSYMCRFILVMAMNPCPCGWYGHEDTMHHCICTTHQVEQYQRTLSGPLRDRLDMYIPVDRPKLEELQDSGHSELSVAIRQRVMEARERQQKRAAAYGIKEDTLNSRLSHHDLQQMLRCDSSAEQMMETAFTRLHISLRSYDKLLRVAQTVADLAGDDRITGDHIATALAYRGQ